MVTGDLTGLYQVPALVAEGARIGAGSMLSADMPEQTGETASERELCAMKMDNTI